MTARRILFRVHGWLSLPVWLVFCFVCVTGTVSVISHELTWLANPAARASNPDELPPRPLPELIEAAQEAVPDGEVTRILVYEPYLTTAVSVSVPGMPPALVYVNPYTGVVQEVNRGYTFIGFMRALHGWMLFPWYHSYSPGYYLVSAMAFVTIGALLTGVLVYRKFWRTYRRPRLRTGKGLRVLCGDFHRLAGAWSLWFLLIMGLTGLWYLTQAVLWHNAVDIWSGPEPIPAESMPITDGSAPPRITPSQAYDQVREVFPSLRPSMMQMPEHNHDYYSVSGSGQAWLFDPYSYRAFVNPWNGEIAQVRAPDNMNLLQAVSHLADPLHYGTFGGLWTKVLWFLFGLLLSSMSVTGFIIWLKRHIPVRESRP